MHSGGLNKTCAKPYAKALNYRLTIVGKLIWPDRFNLGNVEIKFKTGASIVTTSASRYNGVAATIPYVAAKNALVAVTRSLSAELAPKKIRVNTVSFDYVQTDMSRNILDHLQKTGNEDAQTIIGVSPTENTALPYVF